MLDATSISFVLVIGSVAFLSWNVFEIIVQRFKIPSIIFYILIGITIGPYLIDIDSTFNFQRSEDRASIAYYLSASALGFLIITSFTDLRQSERQVDARSASAYIFGSIAAFIVAIVTGPALLSIAPGLGLGHRSEGAFWSTVLILALGATVTSVPFLTKIFIDLKIIGTVFASTILVSACLIDIIIWAIFPVANVLRTQGNVDVISILTTGTITFGAAALLFFALSFLTRQFERRAAKTSVPVGIAFIVSVSIAATLISVWLGAGLLLGMLIAGLSLGRGISLAANYMPPLAALAKWIFIPAYFILVGRGLVLDHSISIYDVAVFLLWSSAIKISMVGLALSIPKLDLRIALAHGIVFNTRGGPGLVLATVAYASELINVNAFTAFVAASILTAPITEFFLRRWLQKDGGENRRSLLTPATASSQA